LSASTLQKKDFEDEFYREVEIIQPTQFADFADILSSKITARWTRGSDIRQCARRCGTPTGPNARKALEALAAERTE
jgi:hypothetical protein